MLAPAPAPVSITTPTPRPTYFLTVSGVIATRDSWGRRSLATPIFIETCPARCPLIGGAPSLGDNNAEGPRDSQAVQARTPCQFGMNLVGLLGRHESRRLERLGLPFAQGLHIEVFDQPMEQAVPIHLGLEM